MAETSGTTSKIVDLQVLRKLYRFIKPYRTTFYFLVFLTIFLAILAPLKPKIVQMAVDNYIANGDSAGLVNMVLLLLLLLIASAIVQYLHTYLSGWIGQYIIKDIRVKLYQHILRLSLPFFDKTPIGRLVTRNISDVETLSNVFSQGLAALISDLLQVLFIVGFMLWMSWKLTLVSLATLPLLILSTYIFKEKIKVAYKEVRNAVSKLNTFVQEHITGMSIVQIFGNEKEELTKFMVINKEHRRANIKTVLYYSIYFPVAELIQASGIALLIWYGARDVLINFSPVQTDTAIVGTLIAFIMYIQMFFRPIRMIADRFNTIQLGIVSTARIMELLENNNFVVDEGELTLNQLKGNIQFKQVDFSYVQDQPILKKIDFKVDAGQTLALVGATGAGKSSIINLLNRFYDIEKGEILLDEINIKEIQLESLRKNIGMVLQDVFLFSASIWDNITLFDKSIDEERVLKASKLVGAHDFIMKLPEDYSYNVMERGATLSTGQRQLLSFVRALVFDPKVIILDEATASVDSETEALIQYAIDQLMKGRTAIVIAHRLSTIQKADQIIVLDQGEIIEKGDHETLLKKGGHYAHLHEVQYQN